MEFLIELVDGVHNVSAEERATMCDLRIMVGQVNSCLHWDDRVGAPFESIRVPAVYLAEGLAKDWWSIFGCRDRRQPIWPYRTGFILPSLILSCDGSTLEVSGEQLYCDNPGLRFWQAGSEVVSRQTAEETLADFVSSVIDRLRTHEISDSEVAVQWARVEASRKDPEESAFCEAAGALGVDPYSIDEADAQFIESAGSLFEGDVLSDFLAGLSNLDRNWRHAVLSAARTAASDNGEGSRLPELRTVSDKVNWDCRRRFGGERAWAPGYRCARAFREVIGVKPADDITSVISVAERLGSKTFQYSDGLPSLLAMVSRRDDIHIHLRGTSYPGGPSENFNFARAIGDAVCFPDGGFSVVNGLHGTERQAMGRAFAAEFLAPVDRVMDMRDGGRGIDQIASTFAVSEELIERQIENQYRIQEACE